MRVSALPDLFARCVPLCTFEGDNYVLVQQTARYQLKELNNHIMHPLAPLAPGIDYIYDYNTFPMHECIIEDPYEWLNPLVHENVLKHRAIRLLVSVNNQIEISIDNGLTQPDAWNDCQIEFLRLAKAHCYLSIARTFTRAIETIKDPEIVNVLQDVYCFFILNHIDDTISDFLEDGFMNGRHVEQIRFIMKELLKSLRPNIVPLVDAFNFSDSKLWHSALGRYDGNVYSALYESTKKDKRNYQDVSPAYHKYLKQLLSPESKL